MTAERLALWWVDRYTRGLTAAARGDRRAELASDIWEQRSAPDASKATQLAIFSRCVRGVPADLSWRRAQRHRAWLRSPRALARAVGWSLAGVAYLSLTLVHAWVALPLLGLEYYGADWDESDVRMYARIGGVLLALLVLGAILLRRLPRTGAALISAGALGTPIAFFWGALAYGSIAIVVTFGAVTLARRRRRTLEARQRSVSR